MKELHVKLFSQTLENPIFVASGIFGYGDEYSFIDYKHIAGFCTKGISLKEKKGNPIPRIAETNAGMLNSIGLQNIGLDNFLTTKLDSLKNINKKIIVNFFGNTFEEYKILAEKLGTAKNIFALEMNVSCPNVKEGCLVFGQDAKTIFKLVSSIKKLNLKTPLIVKLTPNTSSISDIAKACEDAGADAVSLINTLKGMKIDIIKRKPYLGAIYGGLSGPAIKPVAVRCVYEVKSVIKIPIIGIGGIKTYEDVLEFIMAGATCVQVGSQLFNDVNVCKNIYDGLLTYCIENKVKISELCGVAV